MSGAPQLSRLRLLAYAALAFPIAFAGLPLYVHAPDLYASQYGISLTTIGVALLALRFLDALQDPLIGMLGDRFPAHRPYIMIGAATLLVLSFFALFHPPHMYVLPWFIACVFLSTTAYSILSVHLNTLGALWGKTPAQQTRISSMREAISILGLIIAVSLPAVLPEATRFVWLSVVLMGSIAIALPIFLRWYQTAHVSVGNALSPHVSADVRQLGYATKCFFAVYFLSMLASSIPTVLIVFFVRDLLHAEAYLGLFLLLYFTAGIAGMPLWRRISQIHGKHHAWMLSMLLAVTGFVGAYFLSEGQVIAYALICIMSGFAFGAELILPPSILADYVNNDTQRATTHYGMLGFFTKSALAVGSAFSLLLLDLSGFLPNTLNDQVALSSLSMLYAAIPCAIKLMSVAMLWLMKATLIHGVDYESSLYHRFSRSHTHA